MCNLSNICCLCLDKNNISRNLSGGSTREDDYYRKIKSFFPELDFGDTIDSYKLCSQCCATINLVYDFKRKCFTSLNVFRSYTNLSSIDDSIVVNRVETDVATANDRTNGNNEPKRVLDDDEFSIASSKNSDIRITVSEVVSDNANVTTENLGLDLEANDAGSTKKFECTICQKKFMYYSTLHKHIKSHKLIYNPKLESDPIADPNIYNIEVDEVLSTSAAPQIDKPYQCHICFRKFSQFSSLISHRQIHLNDNLSVSQNVKVFKCKICLKTFNKRKSLMDHKEVHSIDKPFECEICKVKFDSYSVLINHRKCHL